MTINIIGAGLAGCEAAYQLAKRKIEVNLYEMKPHKKSDAHTMDLYGELVCSNSLKSCEQSTSSGMLKNELELMDSLILKSAYENKVPAGGALAVDRVGFSKYITDYITNNEFITVINEEVTKINEDDINIICTGPLSSDGISKALTELTDLSDLYFFDAAAPILNKETINMDIAFKASRYNKSGDDYINCPMNFKEYKAFHEFIINAEIVELKDFENKKVFEGCMPVEVMAKRGFETLRFGPLKPVGLDEKAYAVIQLRQDNSDGSLYNMVGFQTNLKFSEQKKMMKLIPSLENATIERYGVMHKNTYINSPKLLNKYSQLKNNNNIFIGGQLSGVEGYLESTLSGLICAINVYKMINNEEMVTYSRETLSGALMNYISDAYINKFQPMTSNFGILLPLKEKIKNKKEKKIEYVKRGLEAIKANINEYNL